MKIRIIENIYQSMTNSQIGDTGDLVGFCRGGDGRPYATIVLDKNNKFDMVPLYTIEKI